MSIPSRESAVPILILSCQQKENYDKRGACRETWIRELRPEFRPLFLLGSPKLQQDWRFQGDVLLVRCEDGYAHLTEKLRLGLLAVLERFDFPWLFKCDDDTWLNPWQLNGYPFWQWDQVGSFCWGGNDEHPVKWASGAGYSLSRRAAVLAAEGLLGVPPGQPEDQTVSYLVQKMPGARLRHEARFLPFTRGNWQPCLLGHWIKTREEMKAFHTRARRAEGALAILEPGEDLLPAAPAPPFTHTARSASRPARLGGDGRIHVQCAAYREADLVPTLRSLFSSAADPERLSVAICWQHAEDESLEEFAGDKRVRAVDVPWQKSQGLGWARRITQYLYQGEEYTFQIDAHERFVPGWDHELVEMLNLVDSDKPMLTTYPASFVPGEEVQWPKHPLFIRIQHFREDGSISVGSDRILNFEELSGPVPARFLAGGFFFTLGQHCREVLYDAAIYFNDEISMAARSFTHGYDLFTPHKHLAWHHYIREGGHRHWTDHTEDAQEGGNVEVSWQKRVSRGRLQLQQLFGQVDHGIKLGEHGWGSVRTLADYEAFAGLDFRERRIHEATLAGAMPPASYEGGRWLRLTL